MTSSERFMDMHSHCASRRNCIRMTEQFYRKESRHAIGFDRLYGTFVKLSEPSRSAPALFLIGYNSYVACDYSPLLFQKTEVVRHKHLSLKLPFCEEFLPLP